MAEVANILISTGDIRREHNVLSIIFAAGMKKFGGKGFWKQISGKGIEFMTDEQYTEMLDQVYVSALHILKEKAAKAGADAVVNCKFDIEQITLQEKGMVSQGEALRIQVFVTGTAVKFV